MPKKLAVGARKVALKGKRSASKRELIKADDNEKRPSAKQTERKRTNDR